ncbi:tautomerase family protein, partial [Candidatus Woesearchaeota archaeon]|nr:tautomerase family protein [Candidatus Woesearchaeota archaeon]
MPVVTVDMWHGRRPEEKEAIIRKITHVFIEMGITADQVIVKINEVPKENWGVAGK